MSASTHPSFCALALTTATVVAGSLVTPSRPSTPEAIAATVIVFHNNGAWSRFEDERAVVDPATGTLLVSAAANEMGTGGAGRDGNVEVVADDLTTGTAHRVLPHAGLEAADHDSAALSIRPDGRDAAMYSRHNTDPLSRWWVTPYPGDPSQSGPGSTFLTEAFERGDAAVDVGADLTRPHLLHDAVADVIVRVRGSFVCSGTPITGTPLVITAAHCVLDGVGDVTAVTVERDGVDYLPRAVLVNPRYHDAPSPHLDAAVLVMDRAIPGPAATLADTLPTHGLVTLAGFQPIDTDGTLLRGTSYRDRPTPKGVNGGVIEIKSRPSGCVHRASTIEIADDQLKVGCGLVPGASGGGLFIARSGRLVLLGIISTVGLDLSFNGLTPLAALHELLNHPREYTHTPGEARPLASQPPITRK